MIPDRIGNIRMVFPRGKTLMLEDPTHAGTPAGSSVILSFSVNYCFLLSFPRPRGHNKTPEILHTFCVAKKQSFNPRTARLSTVNLCFQIPSVSMSAVAAGHTKTGSDPSIQETRNPATISDYTHRSSTLSK